ncbi:MAG TPA: hypothetical protein VIK72_11115 [Clostridiaceae bacterium]
MRFMKKIIVWTLTALLIQAGFLLYINNVYLNHQFKLTEVRVDDNTSNVNKAKVKLPASATDTKISYDGNYISYLEDGFIKVVDFNTGIVTIIKTETGMTNCYSKWLPTTDLLMIAEKTEPGSTKQYIDFYSYDIQSKDKKQLIDYHDNKTRINLVSKLDTIDKIVFSTQTHVIYVKILKSSSKSDIYRFNVMNEVEKLKTNISVGNIILSLHESNLTYEDPIKNKIIVMNTNKVISNINIKKPVIVATDDNDNLYVGDNAQAGISKIIYGKIAASTTTWAVLSLDSPTENKNIIVTPDGKVYINDPLKGYLTDVTTKANIVYKGVYVRAFNNGVLSLQNGILLEKLFS